MFSLSSPPLFSLIWQGFHASLTSLPQRAKIFAFVGETREKQAVLSEDVPTAKPFPRLSLWRRMKNIPENAKHSDEAY